MTWTIGATQTSGAMYSDASVIPAVMGILLLVFFGLMFVAGVVGTILFFAGKPRSGVRRVGGALAFVCGSMFGILLLGGLALTGVRVSTSQEIQRREQKMAELKRMGEELHQRQAEQIPQPKTDDIQTPPPATVASNQDVGLQPLPADAVPPSASGAANHGTGSVDSTTATGHTVSRPVWIDTPLTTSGDVTQIVLSSKQYSTVEEARQEVATAAAKLLADDFERIYGVSADILRNLSVDTLKTNAVKQEYVETADRDFGNFTAPMHRVWWQVELSPVVRTALHPIWKGGVQEQRVIIVAGGLLAATVCLAGWSLFSRRRRAALPPDPTVQKAAAVVIGVGALTLLAQKCRRWWQT